jgi:hypothetical protein
VVDSLPSDRPPIDRRLIDRRLIDLLPRSVSMW